MSSYNTKRVRPVKVQVYLNTLQEQKIFEKIKDALGEDDSGTFAYILKNYAERMNLISCSLHERSG